MVSLESLSLGVVNTIVFTAAASGKKAAVAAASIAAYLAAEALANLKH